MFCLLYCNYISLLPNPLTVYSAYFSNVQISYLYGFAVKPNVNMSRDLFRKLRLSSHPFVANVLNQFSIDYVLEANYSG